MDWMDAMDYKDVAYQHQNTRVYTTDGSRHLAKVVAEPESSPTDSGLSGWAARRGQGFARPWTCASNNHLRLGGWERAYFARERERGAWRGQGPPGADAPALLSLSEPWRPKVRVRASSRANLVRCAVPRSDG